MIRKSLGEKFGFKDLKSKWYTNIEGKVPYNYCYRNLEFLITMALYEIQWLHVHLWMNGFKKLTISLKLTTQLNYLYRMNKNKGIFTYRKAESILNQYFLT